MRTHNNSEQSSLALLFAMQHADMRLSESQLARIMSETSTMNFFDLKTALNTLVDGGQIEETPTLRGLVYSITPAGTAMIDSLRTTLRHSVRESLTEFLAQNAQALQNESRYPAAYSRIGGERYRAEAQILSDDVPIFQLTMILESREEANVFVANWKEKGSEIYQRILLDLTV